MQSNEILIAQFILSTADKLNLKSISHDTMHTAHAANFKSYL